MLQIPKILKQTIAIISYNAIPYYLGKNWTNIKKYANIPITLHK